MNTPGGRLRADAARNRESILRAARRCFAERGAAVSLAEIAREAGVGAATVHRRFGGRAALLDELVDAQVRALVCVAARAAQEADPAVALSALLRGLFDLRASDRTITTAMTRPRDATSTVALGLDRFDAAVDEVVARARSAGVVRLGFDRDDVLLLTLMVGTVADVRATTGSHGWRRASAVLLDGVFHTDACRHCRLLDAAGERPSTTC